MTQYKKHWISYTNITNTTLFEILFVGNIDIVSFGTDVVCPDVSQVMAIVIDDTELHGINFTKNPVTLGQWYRIQ